MPVWAHEAIASIIAGLMGTESNRWIRLVMAKPMTRLCFRIGVDKLNFHSFAPFLMGDCVKYGMTMIDAGCRNGLPKVRAH